MVAEVNWFAIIVAAVSTMVVGSLWYGPLFGKAWMKLAHVKPDPTFNAQKAIIMYGGAFLTSLLTAIILAIAIFIFHFFNGASIVSDALTTGLFLWLGFTAARIQMHDSFEGRRKKLTLLSISHELVTIEIMALIIALFPVA